MEIYQYDDYKPFLKDRYDAIQTEKWFSCRKFADRVGISNPGYVGDVIAGRRPLSKHAATKLGTYFGLNPKEQSFFELLIDYNHAKSETAREEFYRSMQSRRSRSRFACVNNKYYDDFRYPLIRTALMAVPFSGEYELLAKRFRASISVADLKRLIRNLCAWGIVDQDSKGVYTVTDQFVEPEPQLTDQMKMLHREWIRQGMTALEELPREQRHVSSQLLAVSSSTADKIRQEIELFRERIWAMVEQDSDKPTELIQLNIQSFSQLKPGAKK